MQLENSPAGRMARFLTTRLRSVVGVLIFLAGSGDGLAQTRVYVPQVIAGGETTKNRRTDFVTIFHVFSLAPDTVRIRISTFQDNGEPWLAFFEGGVIGGGRRLSESCYVLNGFSQEDTSTTVGAVETMGWAVIETLDFDSREPIAFPIAVAVTLETQVRGFEGDTTRATLLVPAEPSTSFFTYASIQPLRTLSGATGIALLNPSDTATAAITLRLIGRHAELGEIVTIQLEPGHKLAGFLNHPQLFPQIEGFEGTVEVRSTGPISAASIRVGQTYWSSFGIFPARPIPGLDGGG